MKKVIVIGAGASGFVSAIVSARLGNKVIILEKNNNCGKKLLVTGAGRCNYFNEDMTIKHYRSNNIDIVNQIINNSDEVLEFFDSIGIVPKIKNGYYYPYSNMSSSIQNSLLLECEKLGIKIINNTLVTNVEKDDSFIIYTNNGNYECDKLIVASGSKASIKDEYNCYSILEKLGHSIIKPLPALVQLVGNENYFKSWEGIRSDVNLTLYEDNTKKTTQYGEVLFTNYGISGIVSLNLSSFISRGLDLYKKEVVGIDFLPFIDDCFSYLEDRSKKLKSRNLVQLFESIINYKLLYIILKKCHINSELTFNELTDKDKKLFVSTLKDFRLEITATKDFNNAQVVSGGVDLNDINPDTLESKIIKDLYIVGEVLDVDGECGGYNLGFAWMSGIKAGKAINND